MAIGLQLLGAARSPVLGIIMNNVLRQSVSSVPVVKIVLNKPISVFQSTGPPCLNISTTRPCESGHLFTRIWAKQTWSSATVKGSIMAKHPGVEKCFNSSSTLKMSARKLANSAGTGLLWELLLHGRNGSKWAISMSPSWRKSFKMFAMRWFRFSRIRARKILRMRLDSCVRWTASWQTRLWDNKFWNSASFQGSWDEEPAPSSPCPTDSATFNITCPNSWIDSGALWRSCSESWAWYEFRHFGCHLLVRLRFFFLVCVIISKAACTARWSEFKSKMSVAQLLDNENDEYKMKSIRLLTPSELRKVQFSIKSSSSLATCKPKFVQKCSKTSPRWPTWSWVLKSPPTTKMKMHMFQFSVVVSLPPAPQRARRTAFRHEMAWNEIKWNEMNWNEMKRNEMKRNEMKRNELNWNEMKRNEMKWTELNWKEKNEIKWNEMTWNEMKWNEMKWNEMKWNEMNWTEMKRNEMKWTEELNWKEQKMKSNEMTWNEMKWNEMKWNETKCSLTVHVPRAQNMMQGTRPIQIARTSHHHAQELAE